MSSLVLVDTSVFVDYLRGNEPDDSFSVLVAADTVVLSQMVKLELMAGVSKRDLKPLAELFSGLRQLESFASFTEIEKVMLGAKGSGLYGGIPDLMILADARRSKAKLYSRDQKLLKLARKLRIPVL